MSSSGDPATTSKTDKQWLNNAIDTLSLMFRCEKKLGDAQCQMRTARQKFKDQIVKYRKSTCRLFCENMHTALPRELRDMIYNCLLEEHNITFCESESGTVLYANGQSLLHHCFDSSYTGYDMHREILEELSRRNSRFDFYNHHKMIGDTFLQYTSDFGFDLAPIIRSISIKIVPIHVKKGEIMLRDLEALFQLRKGTTVTIFVESGGITMTEITHDFRKVLRVIFPLLNKLHKAEYKLNVVLNPAYVTSTLNKSSATTFSVISNQEFRYLFTPNNATFTLEGFEEKLNEYFLTYKGTWYHRVVPIHSETLGEDFSP